MYKIFKNIAENIKNNKRCALVTVTKSSGSTPGHEGFMMGVFENGETIGTIGGGELEYKVTQMAIKAMDSGKDGSYSFNLNDTGSLHMKCGGDAEVFIKVFKSVDRILIAGGGHVGLEIFNQSKLLGFYTVILDDREEFANKERFKDADEVILGSIDENLKKYPIDNNCYVVIVTRGHANDEVALRAVINSNAKYIGMIGSPSKVKYILDNIEKEGISKEKLDKVYSPIGIALGGDTPCEIALSILSEIMLVKYDGKLQHMRDKLKIQS